MQRYEFDGLEINWKVWAEQGRKTWIEGDEDNYAQLLEELRGQLNAHVASNGQPYLLTIHTGAILERTNSLDLPQISKYVDWITLAAYDLNGSWIPFTGFQSALYQASDSPFKDNDFHNADSVVQAHLTAGVPSQKVVLSVPFFGRGWKGVGDTNDGLWQIWAEEEQGTWDDGGRINYFDIKFRLTPTYTHWDDEALVPWFYNPDTGIMISYEDSESLRHKAEYVKKNNLGGIAIWELSRDDNESTLLNTLYKELCDSDC